MCNKYSNYSIAQIPLGPCTTTYGQVELKHLLSLWFQHPVLGLWLPWQNWKGNLLWKELSIGNGLMDFLFKPKQNFCLITLSAEKMHNWVKWYYLWISNWIHQVAEKKISIDHWQFFSELFPFPCVKQRAIFKFIKNIRGFEHKT